MLRRTIYTKILYGAIVKFAQDFEVLCVEPRTTPSIGPSRGLGDSGFSSRLTAYSIKSIEDRLSDTQKVVSNTGLNESCEKTGFSGGHSIPSSQQESCVVCLCEADTPSEINCGHSYCKGCLVNQCLLTTPPFKCPGDSGSCTHNLTVNDVQAVLDKDQLEGVFNRALSAYVRSHSDELLCCPTSDCSGIFRVSTETTSRSCPVCSAAICTACNALSHPNLTCAQHRDSMSGWTMAFAQWKVENDVQDCPGCRTSIEKPEGCNHMTCEVCGKHFCWKCPQISVFRSEADVYAHMRVEHESWGVEPEERGQFNADGW